MEGQTDGQQRQNNMSPPISQGDIIMDKYYIKLGSKQDDVSNFAMGLIY